MRINKLQIIGLLLLVSLLTASLVSAGTGTITIYGTNVSNAQANVTVTDLNDVVRVTAWNVNGIKTFYVNVTNASDTLTVILGNSTVGQVNELKINSKSINGYQVDSTGTITILRTQTTSNYTFDVRPAVNQGGFNSTWGWFWNLWVNGVSMQPQTVYKESYTGNAVTTNFTTANPVLTNSSDVWINGLHQSWTTSYQEWANGINFTAAPGNGALVDIEYIGN